MINGNIVIVEDLIKSEQAWQTSYDYYHKVLQDGFEDDETFLLKVRFKFTEDSDEEYSLYLTGFIINMALWKPFIYLKSKIGDVGMRNWNEDHIINPQNISKKYLINKINEVLIKPFRRYVTNRSMNEIAYSITKCWKDIAEIYGPLMAISINVYDDIQFCKSSPEYNDLLHTYIPEDLQPKEVEQFVNKRTARVIQMIKDNPYHCLSTILISGEGIKSKQFKEYSTSVAIKPDGQGGIYPLPVNTSFLRGHRKVSDFFIDGTSGRIAQIIQRKNVSSAGAFARQLALVAIEVKLHEDPEFDCGTKHRILFKIETEEHLKNLHGLYICDPIYRGREADHEFMLNLDEKDYSYLIGTSVLVRSAVTCASEKICHKCYGDLAYTNSDINIGAFASNEMTERITQKMLSAKHLLEASSKAIEFTLSCEKPEESLISSYKDLIYMKMDEVKLADEHPEILSRFTLVIGEDDLETEEIESDTKEENEFKIYMNSFKLVDDRGVSYKIECSNSMYISDELSEFIGGNILEEDGYAEIPLVSLLGKDTTLACVTLENNEISKSFNEIKSLIGSEQSVKNHDLDSLFNAFCNTLVYGDFGLMFTHAAVLLRPLIRSKYDTLKYPNWQRTDYLADYTILGLLKAVIKSPSLIIGLSFERLRNQLIDPITFKKCGGSTYDSLFQEKE